MKNTNTSARKREYFYDIMMAFQIYFKQTNARGVNDRFWGVNWGVFFGGGATCYGGILGGMGPPEMGVVWDL